MSDSEAKPDLNVEHKVADAAAAEAKETTCCSSTDSSATKPEISNVEPPSDLEQKIIKQVEVCDSAMIYIHCVSKKVPTFKLSVTLSNLSRYSNFLHCWKAYEICYKTHTTLSTSP